jgi:uncharacterized membrane protein
VRPKLDERANAMINGALIAMGILGIVDNIVIHWMIGLHRAIEGSEYALHAEIVLIIGSAILLMVGLQREMNARRRGEGARAEG